MKWPFLSWGWKFSWTGFNVKSKTDSLDYQGDPKRSAEKKDSDMEGQAGAGQDSKGG